MLVAPIMDEPGGNGSLTVSPGNDSKPFMQEVKNYKSSQTNHTLGQSTETDDTERLNGYLKTALDPRTEEKVVESSIEGLSVILQGWLQTKTFNLSEALLEEAVWNQLYQLYLLRADSLPKSVTKKYLMQLVLCFKLQQGDNVMPRIVRPLLTRSLRPELKASLQAILVLFSQKVISPMSFVDRYAETKLKDKTYESTTAIFFQDAFRWTHIPELLHPLAHIFEELYVFFKRNKLVLSWRKFLLDSLRKSVKLLDSLKSNICATLFSNDVNQFLDLLKEVNIDARDKDIFLGLLRVGKELGLIVETGKLGNSPYGLLLVLNPAILSIFARSR
jgi:hypothetical protein